MAKTRVYRDGNLIDQDFPPERISDYLEDPSAVVWLDLCYPTSEDFAMVGEEFGLHALAVEDALHRGQRPKLDRYDSHLFLSSHAVRLDENSGQLSVSELAVFITQHALITVRKDDQFDIEGLLRRWDDNADLAKHGAAFLVYGLLDFLIDTHFDTVQQLDGEIEKLEDLLFEENRSRVQAVQRRSYELRKSLVRLRRVVLPMREVVNSLMRPTTHVVPDAMAPYYQDVYDHVLRATEWTESLRDLVTTILETNLTIQSNRMNMIMKKVTSWAAIIAVPTAVTGFYGQNVPYPGFGKLSGFIESSLITLALAVGLYVIFRRKDWL
jgi:magnesium transporter